MSNHGQNEHVMMCSESTHRLKLNDLALTCYCDGFPVVGRLKCI